MARKASPILTRTVRAFLSAPRIARLATVGKDGYPHVVPIYFMREGDHLLFGTDDGEQKVRNALRHPKGTVVIGGQPGVDEAGYMIQGDLRVEPDMERRVLRRMLRRYETPEEAAQHLAEWAESDTVIIRLIPRKVIRVL